LSTFSLKSTISLGVLLLAMLAGPGQAEDLAVSRQDIDVSGLGHNPEWQLEINHTDNRINLTLAGTEYNFRYPATGPSLYRGATRSTVYRVPNDDHALTITVKGIECRDSETGKAYETTIMVVMDGVGYQGCGDVLNR
jgi:uncharacterized membrane protein